MVVTDCQSGKPSDSFGIERHHDGVAWTDIDGLRAPKPACTATRNDVAICANHVNTFAIRFWVVPPLLAI